MLELVECLGWSKGVAGHAGNLKVLGIRGTQGSRYAQEGPKVHGDIRSREGPEIHRGVVVPEVHRGPRSRKGLKVHGGPGKRGALGRPVGQGFECPESCTLHAGAVLCPLQRTAGAGCGQRRDAASAEQAAQLRAKPRDGTQQTATGRAHPGRPGSEPTQRDGTDNRGARKTAAQAALLAPGRRASAAGGTKPRATPRPLTTP